MTVESYPCAAKQALEAGGARRILSDDSFTGAPQLKRHPLGSASAAPIVPQRVKRRARP
jgi:hypothetical protein